MKQNLKLYLVEYVIIWREEKQDKDKITSKQAKKILLLYHGTTAIVPMPMQCCV